MRQVLKFFCLFLLIAALVIGGGVGFLLYLRYRPSKEKADPAKVWAVRTADGAALYLNNERQDTDAVFKDGTFYLPLTWVQDNLNERYYYDEADQLLLYTLPTEIEKRGADDVTSAGTPAFVEHDGSVLLSLDEVQEHTDLDTETFTEDGYPRLFATNLRDPYTTATVRKDCAVRVRGGVKSAILTEAKKGSSVIVITTMDKWSEVRTADGYIGYTENRYLTDPVSTERDSTFEEPEYTHLSHEGKITMAWHQTTSQAANALAGQLLQNTKNVNVISPTWFALSDNSGSFESLASADYVKQMHDRGIQVWALVDNFGHDFSKNLDMTKLLGSLEAREKLISGLVSEVKKYDIDGLNIDFESLPQKAGVHYIEFIRELSVSCRNEGIVLSIDNYPPASYNQFYDLTEQGAVADYVVFMGYDEHYAGSDAGSVASISYTRDGISNALEQVPASQVIWGVPFYSRIWTVDGDKTSSETVSMTDAEQWIAQNSVEMNWDDETGQYYGELDAGNGAVKRLWQEEKDSLALKMKAIRDSDLAGVSAWKLGMEKPEVWDSLSWNAGS